MAVALPTAAVVLVVGAGVAAQNLTVSGRATVNTASNPIYFTDDWDNAHSWGNMAQISNDTDSFKALMLVGNASYDGTTRIVAVWDRLDVNGPTVMHNSAEIWGGTNIFGTTAIYNGAFWVSSGSSADAVLNSDKAGTSRLLFRNNTDLVDMILYRAPNTRDVRFWSSTIGDLFTITQDGKVGIGTTTPNAKLHIEGGSNLNAVLRTTGAGAYYNTRSPAVAWNGIWNGTDGVPTTWFTGMDGGGNWVVANSSWNQRLVVAPGGNVGIGTTSPNATYLLHVNGKAAGTSWTNLSSREYKEDIRYLGREEERAMLERLARTNLATYRFRKEHGGDGSRQLGFIAEELPPEVLAADGKGVDTYELLAYAIGAVKAQQAELKAQQAELKAQQAELRTQQAELKAQQAELKALWARLATLERGRR
jgi:FtsZ-binding cell division protein ZapB